MLRNILIASLLAWSQTTTQTEVWRVLREQAPLRGITAVTIKVQALSDDAARCGITADSIRSAASRPFADAGLRVLDDPGTGPRVALQVSVLAPAPTLCIANINADLLEEAPGALPHKQTLTEAKVVDAPLTVQLLRDGTFAAGLTADFAQKIQASVRSLADGFAAKIKQANPR
ncbi:MAG TPA: hypothetical protein VJN96_14320 [Vicinamibacterales bacterium]|nr:hypothetical protein [Vicinamibacterales bacterium]